MADVIEAGQEKPATNSKPGGLVRPLPHHVARRAVLADPDFPSAAPGYGASHRHSGAPDDLRVVPAHIPFFPYIPRDVAERRRVLGLFHCER